MNRAARAVENGMPDQDENVRGCYRLENDKAILGRDSQRRKNNHLPRAGAGEMSVGRFSLCFLPGQHRAGAPWAPKRESAFRSHRSIPLRSDIGGRCALESRNSFAHQPHAGSALRRFLFSSLTSTIKTQLAKRDGDSGETPRQTYVRISSTLHKMAALAVAGLKANERKRTKNRDL